MTKEQRRKLMPLTSAFLDDIREAFGEIVYIKAEENGQKVEWGKPLENAQEMAA